jgi:hypothetical protein
MSETQGHLFDRDEVDLTSVVAIHAEIVGVLPVVVTYSMTGDAARRERDHPIADDPGLALDLDQGAIFLVGEVVAMIREWLEDTLTRPRQGRENGHLRPFTNLRGVHLSKLVGRCDK